MRTTFLSPVHRALAIVFQGSVCIHRDVGTHVCKDRAVRVHRSVYVQGEVCACLQAVFFLGVQWVCWGLSTVSLGDTSSQWGKHSERCVYQRVGN